MAIGLVGRGYVGTAVQQLFESHTEVVSWDIRDDVELPADDLKECDVVVVAVNTPSGKDGNLDASAVEDAIASVPNKRILLKSTVPPGTTDRLARDLDREICFWPEYIGQSSYHNPFFPNDIAAVPFVILGGAADITSWCLRLLQPVLGPTKTYFRCSATEAEMIKLSENAFLATKVTFVNELKRICDAVGADWDTVREGWLLDPRIGRSHSMVFPDAPGFSGACLPKDTSGLHAAARDAGYDARFIAEVLASNDRFRDRSEK